MIAHEQAERIAGEIIAGREEFELMEFSEGWLIMEASASDRSLRGGATLVIERSGRVMQFPSSVPPGRILEEYEMVVHDGSPWRGMLLQPEGEQIVITRKGRRYAHLPGSIVIYIAAWLLVVAQVILCAVSALSWWSLPGPVIFLLSAGSLLLRKSK